MSRTAPARKPSTSKPAPLPAHIRERLREYAELLPRIASKARTGADVTADELRAVRLALVQLHRLATRPGDDLAAADINAITAATREAKSAAMTLAVAFSVDAARLLADAGQPQDALAWDELLERVARHATTPPTAPATPATMASDPIAAAIESVRRVVVIAITERDEIESALHSDHFNPPKAREPGQFDEPGQTLALFARLHPSTGWGAFDAAVQRANAAIIRTALAAPMLPLVAALEAAHRELTTDALRAAHASDRNVSGDVLQAHGIAAVRLIQVVNEYRPPVVTGPASDDPAMSISRIANKAQRSESTIRKAADAAGVQRPNHGQHHKLIPWSDILKIAQADIAANASAKDSWDDFINKYSTMPRT